MRQHQRRLVIAAVTAAWLGGGLAPSEAIAQRTKMLELGPAAMEAQPPRRQPADAPTATIVGPNPSERPWVLGTAWALRPPPPPDERDSARERQQMRKLAAGEDPDALERIRYWDAEPPAERWRAMLAHIIVQAELPAASASHARALLDVAIHDARLAAWDAKNAYGRPRPSELDARLVPEVAVPRSPSYPCEHAVIAAVASEILRHLFPHYGTRVAAAAHEAAWSRVVASAVYPSDAQAGLVLGRAVAAQVIEHATIDASDRGVQLLVSSGWSDPQLVGMRNPDAPEASQPATDAVRQQ